MAYIDIFNTDKKYSVPRLELFARQHVDGWDCWGDEV